jgi:hypothetical protein
MNRIPIIPILPKIQKLLTLSRDEAATEHEAALAAAKVHQLLADYNLSLTEVEAQQGETDLAMRVEDWKTGRLLPWERLLWFGTCQLYFCCSTLSVGRSFIIGRSHNVIVAKEMLAYLIQTVQGLRKAHYGKGRRYLDSFAYGCAQSINDKIQELITARQPAQHETTLPSVRETYRDEVYTFLADQGTSIRKRAGTTRSLKVDSCGYAAGQIAGEKVGLDPQIYSAQRHPKLVE